MCLILPLYTAIAFHSEKYSEVWAEKRFYISHNTYWSSRTVERRVPLVHWWFHWSWTMGPVGVSNIGERPVLMGLFMCCNVPSSRPVLHPTASWNDVQPTDKAVVMDEEHKRKLCHSCCKSFGLACKFHRQLISRVRCSFWYKTWIFFGGSRFLFVCMCEKW